MPPLVQHGWELSAGTFTTLNYPDSQFTQALGINNKGVIVGFYVVSAKVNTGFVGTP